MGDFNPNADNPLHFEPRVYAGRAVLLDNRRAAVATRIRPGAQSIDLVHKRLLSVVGTPGIGVEIVSSLQPTVSETTFVPAGNVTLDPLTSWLDQGGAAPAAADIDEPYNDAEYVRNNGAVSRDARIRIRVDATSPGTGTLSGQRILALTGGATAKVRDIDGNAGEVRARHFLRLNSANYFGPGKILRRTGRMKRHENLAQWFFNPDEDTGLGVLNLPWTNERVDDILDSGDADGMGFEIGGKLADAGFRLSSFWITVRHCTENRIACFYSESAPRNGWQPFTLRGPDSSGGAFAAVGSESANTYYWLVVSCPYAKKDDMAIVNLLRHVGTDLSTSASDNTREHRRGYTLRFRDPAGVPDDDAEDGGVIPADGDGREFLGFLLDDGGSILSQSQAYDDVDQLTLHRSSSVTAQQVRTGGARSYGAVRFPFRWQDPLTRPDAALTVQLRTTDGTGAQPAGSLLATATINPRDFDNVSDWRDEQIKLDVSTPLTAATTYHLVFASSATSGRGWIIPVGDTNSNDIGVTTTVAQIEGASAGGQTTSYVLAGTADDRFDIPVQLIGATDPPQNLVAVAEAAVE